MLTCELLSCFQQIIKIVNFVSRLAYLSDIFGILNHMNMFFQGRTAYGSFCFKIASIFTEARLVHNKRRGQAVSQVRNLSSLQLQHSERLYTHFLLDSASRGTQVKQKNCQVVRNRKKSENCRFIMKNFQRVCLSVFVAVRCHRSNIKLFGKTKMEITWQR